MLADVLHDLLSLTLLAASSITWLSFPAALLPTQEGYIVTGRAYHVTSDELPLLPACLVIKALPALAPALIQIACFGAQVAETFTLGLEDGGAAQLASVARLDTCVTLVDAAALMANFGSLQSLAQREPGRVDDEDDRNVADLLLDQIEFADVLLLNKASVWLPQSAVLVPGTGCMAEQPVSMCIYESVRLMAHLLIVVLVAGLQHNRPAALTGRHRCMHEQDDERDRTEIHVTAVCKQPSSLTGNQCVCVLRCAAGGSGAQKGNCSAEGAAACAEPRGASHRDQGVPRAA